jgi:hypothetical protein
MKIGRREHLFTSAYLGNKWLKEIVGISLLLNGKEKYYVNIKYGTISQSFEKLHIDDTAVSVQDDPEEDNSKEDDSKEDNPKEDDSKEDNPKEDDPKEDNPKEDNPKEDDPKEDNPKEDNPKEDNPKEDDPEEEDPNADYSEDESPVVSDQEDEEQVSDQEDEDTDVKSETSGDTVLPPKFEDVEGDPACVVCLSNRRSIIFDCGHVCTCYSCTTILPKPNGKIECPICRTTVSTAKRAILS